MISSSVAPFFRWSITTTRAVLLPSRGPALSSALAAFWTLGALLVEVVFLVAFPFVVAPVAACAPPFGLRSALSFGTWPRLWMPAHIRPAAVLTVFRASPGFHPATAFQVWSQAS